MGRVKFVTSREAANMIPDEAYIGTVGFMLTGAPEEILLEIENRFLETGSPKDISLMWASGVGDGGTVRGFNHLCHEGLLKKTVGGHYGLFPRIAKLINENKIEAYNFPQGVLTSMFREMAANKPGVLTHVGLGTFVDPDFQGGKLNDATKEDIVEKVEVNGRNYLLYKSQKIDVAIIRGTEADEDGNIGISKEALKLENLSVAMAARNNGGLVIAQVERLVKRGTIEPKNVAVPGAIVDVVAVVKDKKNHMQTSGTDFNIDFISSAGVHEENFNPSSLDAKKIIAKRAALQMDKNKLVLNFGIGVPERVAEVLKEEGIEENFISTVEPGIYGGTAQGGLDFGSAIGPQAIIDHPYQFDFYDGGGIDITFLGMAQCDAHGSLNVSKFGPKIPGCGGFIDISQNAKECVFCGTFTAGGLKVNINNGKLEIVKEGKVKKFVNKLEHITFNGEYESKKNKKITIVTERAVFDVRPEGLTLTEIAPGIDLEKDILAHMEFKPIIADNLKEMDNKIFKDEPMKLKL
ncbi:acetyl-CoA--acetoacetyl-CoA transferase subunit alpha [Caldisalinibacter kiritimatiensis]|uniref:Acetyl-CoA:acetoacetyl-CoA transferase, alpha subunit n=1 Tax=Caldisalinibacter kiritimatiensis TaxID=1304284 RepID=R1CGZ0_9FIRM|nr:acetyl-CoA--acetoacetyl-CoA transferase subunit alpha [Caldisalinibacter kiritimatiensis]EOD01570.1 Acetyl-CoA:acetoacetyl-CoA transferase, alpha subunit [Caldisalinibacter kiritimatiensis]